jgi:signal transduction histidine kinase
VTDRIHLSWRGAPAAPWWRRTRRDLLQLATGGLLWLVPAGLVLVPVGLAGAKHGPLDSLRVDGSVKLAHLVAAVVVLVPAVFAALALTPRFTAWQRARFRTVLRVELVPFDPPGHTWRQLGYHLLGGALTAVATGALGTGVLGGAALIVLTGTRHAVPVGWHLGLAAAGVVLLCALPWLARAAAALDLALARALLQPSGVVALTRQVASLSASRAGVVDAADAERRRIERNLHDGTQQRLVSLAMNLGMARAALHDADPDVHRAVADAHEEAKQALAELRAFIRGLHPAVLDELGLDAALSGLAARSPVPVRLTVELLGRPPAAVETVAYFVVSEALTNVARHAAATRAEVVVRQQPDSLVLSVTDDGRGGADPRGGTGLRGLRQRVDSVDGTLRIASPPGGPTAILVTLPCAS